MNKLFIILLTIIFTSCSSKQEFESKLAANSDSKAVADYTHKEQSKDDKLSIIFMSDFSDSLTIILNDSILGKRYFLTNESIGASSEIITINRPKEKSLLRIIPTDSTEITVKINHNAKYLYVWRKSGNWRHEFMETPLELE